jgi:hypothetical protein
MLGRLKMTVQECIEEYKSLETRDELDERLETDQVLACKVY